MTMHQVLFFSFFLGPNKLNLGPWIPTVYRCGHSSPYPQVSEILEESPKKNTIIKQISELQSGLIFLKLMAIIIVIDF